MDKILPAIIAKDFKELQEKVEKIEGLVSWAQIDVMDGVFVPPKTWSNPKELKKLNTNINFEIHLMVKNPELKIKEWVSSGAGRLLLHYESTDYRTLANVINELKKTKVQVGLAFKMETDLSEAEEIIKKVDVVQLMSIDKIGYYGEAFDARVISRIRFLREKFPGINIEIDGGVNLESAKELLKNGADYLVVGSAIFKSKNIKKTIKKFQSIQI